MSDLSLLHPAREAATAASLASVLAIRDRRAAAQKWLLANHRMPVLSLTLVSPGPVKDSPGRRILMDMAEAALGEALAAEGLHARQRIRRDGETGPEALWAVDAPPGALKRLALSIEVTNAWGRLLDADVVILGPGGDPVPIHRESLGHPPRSCLLCPAPAGACIRLGRHSLDDVAAMADAILLRQAGRP